MRDSEVPITDPDRPHAYESSSAVLKSGFSVEWKTLHRRSERDAFAPHIVGQASIEAAGLDPSLPLEMIARLNSWFVFDAEARKASFSLGGVISIEDFVVKPDSLLEQSCMAGVVVVRLTDLDGRTVDVNSNALGAREGADMIALPLVRPELANTDPRAAVRVSVDAAADASPSSGLIRLANHRAVPRSDCAYCGTTSGLEKEHVLPKWTLNAGEGGLTVKACGPCNRHLGQVVEEPMSRCVSNGHPLRDADRLLISVWTIKTLWALRQSLSVLDDVVPQYFAQLVPVPSPLPAPTRPTDLAIESIFSSLEAEQLVPAIQWGPDGAKRWINLQAGRVVTTLWLTNS